MLVLLVSSVGNMMVVGGMTERASLVSSEKPDRDSRSGRPESTLAGMIENLGAVDEIKAGQGSHGLGGGGQGGG